MQRLLLSIVIALPFAIPTIGLADTDTGIPQTPATRSDAASTYSTRITTENLVKYNGLLMYYYGKGLQFERAKIGARVGIGLIGSGIEIELSEHLVRFPSLEFNLTYTALFSIRFLHGFGFGTTYTFRNSNWFAQLAINSYSLYDYDSPAWSSATSVVWPSISVGKRW